MQRIDWEASYHVLRCVMKQASRKFGWELSDIRVTQMDDGQYRASIDTSGSPMSFTGEASASIVGAKAKLMYAAVSYVSCEMHTLILDLNYPLLRFQNKFIATFDQKMQKISCSGFGLRNLLIRCRELFDTCYAEVQENLSANPCNSYPREVLQIFGRELADTEVRFMSLWNGFLDHKVVYCICIYSTFGRVSGSRAHYAFIWSNTRQVHVFDTWCSFMVHFFFIATYSASGLAGRYQLC